MVQEISLENGFLRFVLQIPNMGLLKNLLELQMKICFGNLVMIYLKLKFL